MIFGKWGALSLYKIPVQVGKREKIRDRGIRHNRECKFYNFNTLKLEQLQWMLCYNAAIKTGCAKNLYRWLRFQDICVLARRD